MSGKLIVKGCAGLADRFYQLLTAIMYAKISGRKIVVDWRDECFGNSSQDNLFEIAFELKSVVHEKVDDEVYNNLSVCPHVWSGQLNLNAHEMIRQRDLAVPWDSKKIIETCSVDISSEGHSEEIAVFMVDKNLEKMREKINDLCPALINMSEGEIQRKLFFDHIQLKPEVEQILEDFCATHMGNDLIGVHVRRTNESGFRSFANRHYFKQTDRLRRRYPLAGIYLATDNADVISAFRKRYGKIITLAKWFPESGIPLHLRAHQNGAPDHVQNFKDAVLEMFILSRCSWLVIPGVSGFSNFASIISEIPSERILSIHTLYSRSISVRVRKRILRLFG